MPAFSAPRYMTMIPRFPPDAFLWARNEPVSWSQVNPVQSRRRGVLRRCWISSSSWGQWDGENPVLLRNMLLCTSQKHPPMVPGPWARRKSSSRKTVPNPELWSARRATPFSSVAGLCREVPEWVLASAAVPSRQWGGGESGKVPSLDPRESPGCPRGTLTMWTPRPALSSRSLADWRVWRDQGQ